VIHITRKGQWIHTTSIKFLVAVLIEIFSKT